MTLPLSYLTCIIKHEIQTDQSQVLATRSRQERRLDCDCDCGLRTELQYELNSMEDAD